MSATETAIGGHDSENKNKQRISKPYTTFELAVPYSLKKMSQRDQFLLNGELGVFGAIAQV